MIDSPYGDLPKLLDTQLSKHSGLPHWFNPGILLAARWIYGVRTDDLVPIRFALMGRKAGPAHPRRVRHDRTGRPGTRAGADPRRLLPDAHPARRRARAGVPEQSGRLCSDGRIVFRLTPQPVGRGYRGRWRVGTPRRASPARVRGAEEGRAAPRALAGGQAIRAAVSTAPAPVQSDEAASAESGVGRP